MNPINKKGRKILCYIYKHPYITFAELNLFKKINGSKLSDHYETEEIINYLADNKFISCRLASSKESDFDKKEIFPVELDSHLVSLPLGDVYVESEIHNDRRWIITTAIAIFAAIGAYQAQLAWLARVITQLLK